MGMLIGQKRINQYRTNQGGGGMDIATNKKKKKPVQKKMSGGILEYKTKGGGKNIHKEINIQDWTKATGYEKH